MSGSKPWLLTLATRQRGRMPSDPVAYDEVRQVALVAEAGEMVPAVLAGSSPETKKADIEKREDQKDRW